MPPAHSGCHCIKHREKSRRQDSQFLAHPNPPIREDPYGRTITDNLERVMGIEPTLSAWEAEVLPLNYTRAIEFWTAITTVGPEPLSIATRTKSKPFVA